jgi:hypothetical protein
MLIGSNSRISSGPALDGYAKTMVVNADGFMRWTEQNTRDGKVRKDEVLTGVKQLLHQ